jgi:hypothetical protein
LELLDQAGHTVPTTAKGRALGQPISQPLRVTTGINYPAGYAGRTLVPHIAEQTPFRFVLQDFFEARKPGRYQLIVRPRVVWITPAWKGSLKTTRLPLVEFPEVKAEVLVEGHY